MADKEVNKLAIFGAIAGLFTVLLMDYIIRPILNLIGQFTPEISAKLAQKTANPVIAINVRESLTGINAGLSGWLSDALGLTLPSNAIMPWIMGAVGGALLIIVGHYAADAFGLLKGNAMQKTRWTIFFGSLGAAFLIGGMAVPELGITLVNALIAFGINAAILAFVYVWIDNQLKIGLIPY
jgi:hypothetical protein